jgi:hypothetical protein
MTKNGFEQQVQETDREEAVDAKLHYSAHLLMMVILKKYKIKNIQNLFIIICHFSIIFQNSNQPLFAINFFHFGI